MGERHRFARQISSQAQPSTFPRPFAQLLASGRRGTAWDFQDEDCSMHRTRFHGADAGSLDDSGLDMTRTSFDEIVIAQNTLSACYLRRSSRSRRVIE